MERNSLFHNNLRIRFKKRGSSTTEYIALFAAVVSVLLVLLRPGGIVQSSIVKSYYYTTEAMPEMMGRLTQGQSPEGDYNLDDLLGDLGDAGGGNGF